MNLEQTERLLEQLHGQLDNAIEKGDRDTARYLYGQIAGALMLALYLRIIDEQENDRRYLGRAAEQDLGSSEGSGVDMNQTANLGLNLPEESDWAEVATLNENWEKVDEAVAKKAELGADGKIPAEQLPEMNYDKAGSAAAVQKNLDAHTGNRSNPHGVTAAQVGAKADFSILPVSQGGAGVPTIAQLAQSLFPIQIGSLPDTSYNFAITGPGWSGNGYMNFQALMTQLSANGMYRIEKGTSDIGAGSGLASDRIYLVYE